MLLAFINKSRCNDFMNSILALLDMELDRLEQGLGVMWGNIEIENLILTSDQLLSMYLNWCKSDISDLSGKSDGVSK